MIAVGVDSRIHLVQHVVPVGAGRVGAEPVPGAEVYGAPRWSRSESTRGSAAFIMRELCGPCVPSGSLKPVVVLGEV